MDAVFLIVVPLVGVIAIAVLVSRAKARAERDEAITSRLARYAGANRSL
jgi:hypothetical protein